MRRKLELLKLQIKSAFLSIPKIILGTIVTAVLVIAISTCIGIATAQDSDMRMKVAVVYPDYDEMCIRDRMLTSLQMVCLWDSHSSLQVS